MEIFVSYLFCLVNVDIFVASFSATTELFEHLTHTSERIGCMLCADKRRAYTLYATHLLSVWLIPVSIIPCFFLPHIGEFVVRVARRHYLMKHRALVYKQQYRRAKVLHFRTMQTLLPKMGEGERAALYDAFKADYTVELGGITMEEFLKIDFSEKIASEYVDPKKHTSDMPFSTDPESDTNVPDDVGSAWLGRNPFTPFQLVKRLVGYFFPTPSGTPGIPDCFASVEMQTTPRVFSKQIVNEFREFTIKKTNVPGSTVIVPYLVSKNGQVAFIHCAYTAGSRFGYPFIGVFGQHGSYSVPSQGCVNAHHGQMIFFMCTGADETERRREFNIFEKVRKGEWTQPIHVYIGAVEFIEGFFKQPAPVANTPRLLEYNWTIDQSGNYGKFVADQAAAENPQPPQEPKKDKKPTRSWFNMVPWPVFSEQQQQPSPTKEEKKESQKFQTKPRSAQLYTYTLMYGMLIDLDTLTWNGEYNTFLYEVAANSDDPKEANLMVREHIAVGAKLTHSCFQKRIVIADVVDAQFWAKQQPDFCGFPYVIQRPGQKNKTATETNTSEELQKIAVDVVNATEQDRIAKAKKQNQDEQEALINQQRAEAARKTVEEVKAKVSAKSTTPPPTADAVDKHIRSGDQTTSPADTTVPSTKPVGFERKEKRGKQHESRKPHSPSGSPTVQWGDPKVWKVENVSDFQNPTTAKWPDSGLPKSGDGLSKTKVELC